MRRQLATVVLAEAVAAAWPRQQQQPHIWRAAGRRRLASKRAVHAEAAVSLQQLQQLLQVGHAQPCQRQVVTKHCLKHLLHHPNWVGAAAAWRRHQQVVCGSGRRRHGGPQRAADRKSVV